LQRGFLKKISFFSKLFPPDGRCNGKNTPDFSKSPQKPEQKADWLFVSKPNIQPPWRRSN